MPVTNQGSVRVDLLGGTLDLEPINLILSKALTLNLATSLKASVDIQEGEKDGISLCSRDYNKEYFFSWDDFTAENLRNDGPFKEMTFLCQLLVLFERRPLKIELSSGAPAGSGLGGSSSMGVTFYKALNDFYQKSITRAEIIEHVRMTESRILNQGVAGYQDYYPALYGGILALHPSVKGVHVEQLFSKELKEYLERNVSLVFSGQARQSGINNWEVYKGFFDKKKEMIEGLSAIAECSYQCYQAIKNNEIEKVAPLICQEGQLRAEAFPSVLTSEMRNVLKEARSFDREIGLKVCGAGGGGCFLLIHPESQKSNIVKLIKKHQMKELNFCIEAPL